jgi:3D (Asp-Asp-Asp) domain-containing protein
VPTAKPTEPPARHSIIKTFTITAYCPCRKCCGKWADGITSTGTTAKEGRTIAVDPDVISYGTEVVIDGKTYIAEDCGYGVNGNRIDMYFNSHSDAIEWGVKKKKVTIKIKEE